MQKYFESNNQMKVLIQFMIDSIALHAVKDVILLYSTKSVKFGTILPEIVKITHFIFTFYLTPCHPPSSTSTFNIADH